MYPKLAEHVAFAQDPATQEVLGQVPLTAVSEIDEAVAAAGRAFTIWKEVATPERARLFLKYQQLLKDHPRGKFCVPLAAPTGMEMLTW